MNHAVRNGSTYAASETPLQIPRRSFMIAAATSISQTIASVAIEDPAANTMWMALNKPCRVLPALESQRLPEWLCRAYCQIKPHCLEHLTPK